MKLTDRRAVLDHNWRCWAILDEMLDVSKEARSKQSNIKHWTLESWCVIRWTVYRRPLRKCTTDPPRFYSRGPFLKAKKTKFFILHALKLSSILDVAPPVMVQGDFGDTSSNKVRQKFPTETPEPYQLRWSGFSLHKLFNRVRLGWITSRKVPRSNIEENRLSF